MSILSNGKNQRFLEVCQRLVLWKMEKLRYFHCLHCHQHHLDCCILLLGQSSKGYQTKEVVQVDFSIELNTLLNTRLQFTTVGSLNWHKYLNRVALRTRRIHRCSWNHNFLSESNACQTPTASPSFCPKQSIFSNYNTDFYFQSFFKRSLILQSNLGANRFQFHSIFLNTPLPKLNRTSTTCPMPL